MPFPAQYSVTVPGATWGDYTPVLNASTTPPTLGSGSAVEGRYCVLGTLVIVTGRIVFGTSGASAGSGTYEISMPYPINASQYSASGLIGSIILFDSGTTRITGGARLQTADPSNFLLQATGSSLSVNDGTPIVWTNNDSIEFHLAYEGVI